MKPAFDESGLRPGQRNALDVILRRLGEKETHTAIVMATRYGKSDLQRIATFAAVELELACAGISLSPTDFLRKQMNKKAKWEAFSERLRITQPIKRAAIDTCVQNPSVNGEIFIATTIQFFQQNLGYWIDWADSMRHRTGKPVLLFVDECQTQSTKNEWGKAVAEWQRKSGGAVILCTATADRSDGEMIPGFEYEEKDRTDIIEYKTRPGSTAEKIYVDVWEGQKRRVEVKAHSTTDFAQAWRENVLCKVEPRWFDFDLKIILGQERDKGLLSALRNKQEIRRALTRGVRHPIAIRGGVDLFIDRLQLMRRIEPRCAGIIFSGNDTETKAEANKHAKEIAKLLPAFDVIIATSAEGDGVTEVERFAEGHGDVLIVKQMASLGLDVSRLKVGLDLSPVRTRAALVQRMMRVATPHDGEKIQLLACSWISPKDLLAQAIFQSVVTDGGGEATVADLEFKRTYEKDRKEGPERPDYIVTGVAGAGAVDSDENIASETELSEVRTFFELAPELGAFVTHPELIRRVKERKGSASTQDTGAEAAAIRVDINATARDVINLRRSAIYSQQNWELTAKNVWRQVKQDCGVAQHLELEQINDLKTLKQIHSTFQAML